MGSGSRGPLTKREKVETTIHSYLKELGYDHLVPEEDVEEMTGRILDALGISDD